MQTLSSGNVVDYLRQLDSEFDLPSEELAVSDGKAGTKNIIFLVSQLNGKQSMVKQERPTFLGDFPGDLRNEWYLHQFLQSSEVGTILRPYIRLMTGYLPGSLVGVYEYLNSYEEFYTHVLQQESIFPTEIDGLIGQALGEIHRTTLNHSETQNALTQDHSFWRMKGSVFSLINNRVTPEMLSAVPPDYLRFIKLYQRFDSLDRAVQEAFSQWNPCCLVHNDLNVANILICKDWRSRLNSEEFGSEDIDPSQVIKIIDWERSSWGDPVMDLGYLASNYLMLWLTSMVIDPHMDLNTALKTATTSIEDVIPSISALVKSYLRAFPESLTLWHLWTKKLMQSIGIGLIIQAQARIEYSAVLSNSDIYALQVAKSFLCRPEASFSTIFGFRPEELTEYIK